MSRRVLLAMFLGMGAMLLVLADADEKEPTSNPQIIAPNPAEVIAGNCYSGIVEDNDPPITVSATWDDTGLSVSGTTGTGGFGSSPVSFSFCTTAEDSGRSFTILAVDGNGNAVTHSVTVL